MAHHCTNHSHVHRHADFWTNFSTAGEGVASFISDSYWLAGIFDLISNFDAEIIGLSYYGIAFGILIASLSASGAAYSHRVLSTRYQVTTPSNHNTITHTNVSKDDIFGDHTAIDITLEEEKYTDADNEAASAALRHQPQLTYWQNLAIIGDFISHTGDISGPLMFVVSLATNNSLTRWQKGVSQSCISIAGGLSSFASVRACRNLMREMLLSNASSDDTCDTEYARNNRGSTTPSFAGVI